MMYVSDFFQIGAIPVDAMYGTYSTGLVILSYVIACFASYVALDFAGRLRIEQNKKAKWYWLVSGAFAMGAGIWSMHFVGMLAFIMPMPMVYEPFWTGLSLLLAMMSSGFALFLLRDSASSAFFIAAGGIVLGIGINVMHYTGMTGMGDVNIHYLPRLFILSVIIAVVAAEAALWLMIQSNKGSFSRQLHLKIYSALIMGAAICGMHYTGMAAAVFTPISMTHHNAPLGGIDPFSLALYIAGVTVIILTIALMVSTYKQLSENATQNKNDFLNAVLNNLSDGVLACDAKGNITVFNPALQKFINSDVPININTQWANYFYFKELNNLDPKSDAKQPIIRALLGEKLESLESDLILKQRKTKLRVIVNGQPIINQYGENLGALIAVRDITEQKKSETEIHSLHEKLVTAARQAGMADIATGIVHNIGNVLNSVNVATSILKQQIKGSEALKFRDNIIKLLDVHGHNLDTFIRDDPHGKQFPQFLKLLAETLSNENSRLLQEVNDIEKNMAHIVSIVSAQKSLTANLGLYEETNVSEIVEDALKINLKAEHREKIDIIYQFSAIKKVITDRLKLLQIMTNLVKNSIDALLMSTIEAKQMTLVIKQKDDFHFMVQVIDNGVGISPENTAKIFSNGFTSKEQGHGFGLHSSANFANEMGGSLSAESAGTGKGAIFTLVLPYERNKVS